MTETLCVESIVEGARARTGLAEFDNESFLAGLSVVVEDVNAGHGSAHPQFAAMVQDIEKWIDARLRVSHYAREHPEVLDAPIERPIIILGAPRTGTTILSYMLDCEPRWRSLLNWEASDPVPPPTTTTLRSDPRCIEKNRQLAARLQSMGDRAPVHWEWADGPTECNHIQSHDFRSQTVHAWVSSERYRAFLCEDDASPTYLYLEKVLRILQSQAPGRWVLKSPSHALFIDAAAEAFPDARFVVTHRNPFDVVASMYSMKTGGFGVLPEEYSHAKRDTPAFTAEFINRPLHFRAARPDVEFFDIYMQDLVRQPVVEVRRLYEWLGEELAPDVEDAMVTWLGRDSSRQSRRPSYQLEDFGVDRNDIGHLFDDYVAAHPRVVETP